MGGFFLQAFIFLVAAVVAVPLAKRFGLGSVLGYLIAGVAVGPLVRWAGADVTSLQHFAEFGVVMMLFIVGLELEPQMLWRMKTRLIGLGGLQVALTMGLVTGAAYLFGQPLSVALAIGMIFALSSTAIVLQTLNEKGLAATEGGRASFSVLLFQDIAVIPMLALLPLLALPELTAEVAQHGADTAHGAAGDVGEHASDHHGDGHDGETAGHGDAHHGPDLNLVASLPPWAQAIAVLASIAAVVLGGHYLSRPIFRYIAQARLREVFTAAALLLVVGIALLMTLVGLSPALGAFLAGVVLATSEFRHELESDIEPFRGLLMGLFFITVGAAIDFNLLFANAAVVFGLTIGLIALKAGVLFGLAKLFRLPTREGWLFMLGLAQAGEFGFVLISFSLQNSVIPLDVSQMLSLIVTLSMMLTPALFILYDKLAAWREVQGGDEREADEINETGVAIIAGLGRFGQIVNRMLLSNGFKTVVLDHRADLVDNLRKFGVRGFYGDATRPDLIHAAGLEHAKMLVVAIDDRERATQLVEHARREQPDIHIIARAFDRHHVYELYAAGANDIVRELFDSSVRAGRYALRALGLHPYDVAKREKVFVDFDRTTLRRLAQVWDPAVNVIDNEEYIAVARERNTMEEAAMQGARTELHDRTERGWTPPPKAYIKDFEDTSDDESEPQS